MWQDIFNPENLFFRTLSKGVDLVGLSLLWLLLCIPVVTIGPATAALYYTVVKVFRYRKEEAFKTYLKAFRENLRQGISVTLVCIPAAIFLAWGYNVMANNISTSAGVVMYMAYWQHAATVLTTNSQRASRHRSPSRNRQKRRHRKRLRQKTLPKLKQKQKARETRQERIRTHPLPFGHIPSANGEIPQRLTA